MLNNTIKITKFYPYEAVQLCDRILSFEKEQYSELKEQFERKLGLRYGDTIIRHENKGKTINYCRLAFDNKVTFECKSSEGTIFYIQFYDGKASIGFKLEPRVFNPQTDYIEIKNK